MARVWYSRYDTLLACNTGDVVHIDPVGPGRVRDKVQDFLTTRLFA